MGLSQANRESADQWLPLTSKDLDLIGTNSLLDGLKQRFGGEYRLSGPRSPVVGQLVVQIGSKNLKIDVLRNVFGLRPKELTTQSMMLQMEMPDETHEARVMPPVMLLQAKITNLARLDQTNRNDAKHVQLMLLVIPAYLSELIEAAESCMVDSRDAIIQLELALKATSSAEATACAASHQIDFHGIWPRALLAAAKDKRLLNFVKHRLPPSD